MKKYVILMMLILTLLTSCNDPYRNDDGSPKYQEISVFQFRNENYKNKVIVRDMRYDGTPHPLSHNGIYLFPYRHSDEPYYQFELSCGGGSNPQKTYQYDICDLATNSLLIELHNGYYIHYPYTNVGSGTDLVMYNAEWSDICDIDLDTVPILTAGSGIYKDDIRLIHCKTICKLTKKKVTALTIEDIVSVLNKIIDEDRLESVSYGAGQPELGRYAW